MLRRVFLALAPRALAAAGMLWLVAGTLCSTRALAPGKDHGGCGCCAQSKAPLTTPCCCDSAKTTAGFEVASIKGPVNPGGALLAAVTEAPAAAAADLPQALGRTPDPFPGANLKGRSCCFAQAPPAPA